MDAVFALVHKQLTDRGCKCFIKIQRQRKSFSRETVFEFQFSSDRANNSPFGNELLHVEKKLWRDGNFNETRKTIRFRSMILATFHAYSDFEFIFERKLL